MAFDAEPQIPADDLPAPKPQRVRVLLLAEACNPQWVSVPLEGWSLAKALRGLADVHLVTQVRNQEAIEQAGWVHGRDFTAIDSEIVARWAFRLSNILRGGANKGWTTVTALSSITYPYFEHLVWQKFGGRIRAGEFDIVHRLTPISPTASSPLAVRCRDASVPFVIGPLNGGVPWPKEFAAARRREKEWLSYLRRVHRLLPGFHQTRAAASALLIGSRDTWRMMPRAYQHKCIYIPENGIDAAKFSREPEPSRDDRPLRVIFVGRLVPYKGADMLLEAAAPLISAGRLDLTIIGDGPELPRLKEFIQQRQLGAGAHLPGWIGHDEIADWLYRAQVFAFPSVREFGGAVVLEAMAAGCVPIVIDYGGPSDLVTPSSGYLIPPGNRQQIIDRFRAALEEICGNPSMLKATSAQARQRALAHFTWDAKSRQVSAAYDWLCARGARPASAMPLSD